MNVGVDRHLFAGHRVEREASRDFGDALRAARDHDELNRHKDRKDDQPDDEISAYDERAERGNDRTNGPRRSPRVRISRVAETSSERRKSVAIKQRRRKR